MTNNKENDKRALANFLGAFMSRSAELDKSTVVPTSKQNSEAIIAKAANDIDTKFGNPNYNTPTYSAIDEVNAPIVPPHQYDPSDNLDGGNNIPMPDLGSGNNITIPDLGSGTAIRRPNLDLDKGTAIPPTISGENQLEFEFTEPSAQTKILISEINQLKLELKYIKGSLDILLNKKKELSDSARKRAKTKRAQKKKSNKAPTPKAPTPKEATPKDVRIQDSEKMITNW